jgi:hypothetical protein
MDGVLAPVGRVQSAAAERISARRSKKDLTTILRNLHRISIQLMLYCRCWAPECFLHPLWETD